MSDMPLLGFLLILLLVRPLLGRIAAALSVLRLWTIFHTVEQWTPKLLEMALCPLGYCTCQPLRFVKTPPKCFGPEYFV